MAFQQGFYFLITSLCSILTYTLVFRFMFTLLSRNYRNDVNTAIARATDPLLKPIRRVLPTVKKVDLALLVVIYGIHVFQWIMLSVLMSFINIPLITILFSSIFTIALQVLNIVSFSIIILVVLSWINPGARNAMTDAMFYMSDWLLSRTRRALPPMGGIDLSPMIALIGIQFINITFVRPFIL